MTITRCIFYQFIVSPSHDDRAAAIAIAVVDISDAVAAAAAAISSGPPGGGRRTVQSYGEKRRTLEIAFFSNWVANLHLMIS